MDKIRICEDCGRTIDSSFLYCPWCGASRDSSVLLAEQIERVCDELEHLGRTHSSKRIDRMEQSLIDMEKELDRILS